MSVFNQFRFDRLGSGRRRLQEAFEHRERNLRLVRCTYDLTVLRHAISLREVKVVDTERTDSGEDFG